MGKIQIKQLQLRAILGVDAWERSKLQPILLSLELYLNLNQFDQDNLKHTISYSTISKQMTELIENIQCKTIQYLAHIIASRILDNYSQIHRVEVTIEKPKALLHASCVGVFLTRCSSNTLLPSIIPPTIPSEDILYIQDLMLDAIIGINPWEREEKQNIIVNLKIYLPSHQQEQTQSLFSYRTIVRTLSKFIQDSSFKTVEALILEMSQLLLYQCHCPKVTLRVEKPFALLFAKSAGIEITRQKPNPIPKIKSVDETNSVLLGIGSNMGNRIQFIEKALASLVQDYPIKIMDTSFLYETKPMYVMDQSCFLNAVVIISTTLEPMELLKALKEIEVGLGRDPNASRHGPRPIDLDILFYNDLEYQSETLVIPHPFLHEREFVLKPLCDLVPHKEHPKLFRTCLQLLRQLNYLSSESNKSSTPQEGLWKVLPIRDQVWKWHEKTFLMGILNATPDSFSDGGRFKNLQESISFALQETSGADIIDIGGMSTRPGSDEIPLQEEISRVIPLIKGIREKDDGKLISIDTYRSVVASDAVKAGADVINDVSGGTLDSDMLNVMAKAKVPVVLMHMRGTPKTMNECTDYPGNDVLSHIIQTLSKRVQDAIQAGIRRWNIILDPGLGFAKNTNQNMVILKNLNKIISRAGPLSGFPMLVGPSRKGFIGTLTQKQDPKDRLFGTAAAVTACVFNGANVIRVHDIDEIVDVLKIADECVLKR